MNRINTPTSSSHHILSLQSMRFIFCTLIFIYHFFESTGKFHFYYGGDAGVTFFFILSGFVLSMGCGASIKITKLLSQRALVFLGNISFEIYMLHGIVITAFVFVWGRLFGYDTVCNPILFAICIVLSLVAAYVFAIIMRIGRYKNNRLQKKA